ncbi:MAG: hypothetical protein KDK91_32650, partial [Gammaproteobacteria bacterium]|nr:hypothetical protein [Gammaproteobacteria bacterium]
MERIDDTPGRAADDSAASGNGSGIIPGPIPTSASKRSAMRNGDATASHADQVRGDALHRIAELRHDPDAIRRAFETGEYPYRRKMRSRDYESHLEELQAELLKA